MLKEKAIRGVKWTSLAAGIGVILQLAQVSILARYLDRSDFGLMALALIVIGFSQLFLDLGTSNAIIHRRDITEDQLSSLFWLNIMTGVVLYGIVNAVAPWMALFYKEPELRKIICLIGLAFLIQPFEQQFYALMKKELHFNEIAKRDILSKVLSFVTAAILAIKGYGVYALVIAYLVGVVGSVAMVVTLGLRYHRPSMHFRIGDVRPFLSFGLFQTGDNVLNYFNAQVDALIIGKLIGVDALGVYNIAKNISSRPAQMINPVVTQVTFPVMAKVQEDIPTLKRVYLKSINYLSSVNFPVYVYMVALAGPIVYILFGPKWPDAVPLLRVLALYAMVRSTFNPLGSILLARGMIKWSFYWNFIMLILFPAAIYIGSLHSLMGAAISLLVVQTLLIIPAWKFLVYPACHATFSEYMMQIGKPALAALFLFGGVYLSASLPIHGNLLRVLVGGAVLMALILPLNKWFNAPFYNEIVEQTRIFPKFKLRSR